MSDLGIAAKGAGAEPTIRPGPGRVRQGKVEGGLLVPRHTKVFSRSDVDLSTTVAGLTLGIPIIAANMSSVCEAKMDRRSARRVDPW